MSVLTFLIALAALILSISNRTKINSSLKEAKLRQTTSQTQESPSGQTQAQAEPVRTDGLRHNMAPTTNPSAGLKYAASTSSQQKEPDILERFGKWITTNPLMKLGGFFIILAIGWFVQFAIAQGWIGEVGRITLAFVVSSAVALFGFWDAFRDKDRGLTLFGVGISGIFATVYAARNLYQMFTPELALLIMFATVAFSVFVALRFNSKLLAGFVFLLAAGAPFMINSQNNDFYGFMGYLLVIVLASLWIVYFKRWHFLAEESFAFTVLYSIVGAGMLSTIQQEHAMFAFIFAAIYFAVSLVAMLVENIRNIKSVANRYLFLALLNTLYIAVWTFEGFNDDLVSLVLLAWAAVFLVASFIVYALSRKSAPFLVYGASALLFIGIITVKELELEQLLLAFTFEATLAVFATLFISKSAKLVARSAMLVAIPTLLAIPALFDITYKNNIISTQSLSLYLFLFVLSMSALALAAMFKKQVDEYKQIAPTLKGFWWIVGVFSFALLWQIPHALFAYDVGTGVSLFIYTAIGLLMYFNKHPRQQELIHKAGVGLLSLVAARLLLVDVWKMDRLVRIVVFVLVGVALIITAYRASMHHKDTTTE